MEMEYKMKLFLLFFVSFIVKAKARPVCHDDQYKVGDRCCYACDPGSRIYRDCPLEGRQTRCQPCAKDTFNTGFNIHNHCTPCTRCDSERGLRLKRSCTKTSDALCETLDGYFCRDPHEGGCREAQRHSVSCSPGHHIGQKGTADKDTECLDCAKGTFSNGTLTSCQPHTNCESLELYQIQPGTTSTDSECAKHGSNVTPVENAVLPFIMPGLFGLVLGVLRMNKAWKEWITSQQSAVEKPVCGSKGT